MTRQIMFYSIRINSHWMVNDLALSHGTPIQIDVHHLDTMDSIQYGRCLRRFLVICHIYTSCKTCTSANQIDLNRPIVTILPLTHRMTESNRTVLNFQNHMHMRIEFSENWFKLLSNLVCTQLFSLCIDSKQCTLFSCHIRLQNRSTMN